MRYYLCVPRIHSVDGLGHGTAAGVKRYWELVPGIPPTVEKRTRRTRSFIWPSLSSPSRAAAPARVAASFFPLLPSLAVAPFSLFASPSRGRRLDWRRSSTTRGSLMDSFPAHPTRCWCSRSIHRLLREWQSGCAPPPIDPPNRADLTNLRDNHHPSFHSGNRGRAHRLGARFTTPAAALAMATDLLYGLVFPIVGTILAWILSVAPIPHLIVSQLIHRVIFYDC